MTNRGSPAFPYRSPPELSGKEVGRYPVAVIGAGPVGLTAALDLARRGVPVVVLSERDGPGVGSRAICWSKRTLEVFDRLGVADPMLRKGVTWNVGKVFFGDRQVYRFDLSPESGHRMPAFINLQQYHVEECLMATAHERSGIDLRLRNRVVGIAPRVDGATLDVETPDGRYSLEADYVLAADGARSPTRKLMSLGFEGKVFEDRFLIADVRMTADFPTERWFWFDPPFHDGGSALLHRQADDVWRIDLQLGRNADPRAERQPERVIPRLKAMLGPERPFELEWVSVYTFQCRRLSRFRHGRVLFLGDSAHQVSPFGARGGNSGIQDADNLCWKLALVLGGKAPERLLDSYDDERIPAADENILHSRRSTDFISPDGGVSRRFRDAVLALSERARFARPMVNSGRLSLAHRCENSPLSAPDRDSFDGDASPGAPCPDSPVQSADGRKSWLLNHLGQDFTLLYFGDGSDLPDLPVRLVAIGENGLLDVEGMATRRYDAGPGTCYLIRPDQHVAARWRAFDRSALLEALDRALARQDVATAVAQG